MQSVIRCKAFVLLVAVTACGGRSALDQDTLQMTASGGTEHSSRVSASGGTDYRVTASDGGNGGAGNAASGGLSSNGTGVGGNLTGGTSGSVVCPNTHVASNGESLIDDLENGTGHIPRTDGRVGVWYAFKSDEGAQWPSPTVPGVPIETSVISEQCSNRRAIHAYGTGVHWAGVGFDLAFDGTKYGCRRCFD